MKILVAAAAVLFVAACAAPAAPGSEVVRQINPDGSNRCKFLGLIEVSGGLVYSSTTEANRDMLAKLRNEVAARGGNAYSLTRIVVERGFSLPFAQGDAYSCP